jgi:protein subunit release factor A
MEAQMTKWNERPPGECVFVEIRAAEGGQDAKLLVIEQRAIYLRVADRRGL